ncbi:MAG TPA: hypothetical protein EYO45_06230 [Candidatus Marinimicrobia bacterium]|nr:hypothetical protein [Candidatus Neomarinimicrobiota bacterium]HIB32687.1 hypothetical protein [Candidatus Neomarinimicrobiota bacterium]
MMLSSLLFYLSRPGIKNCYEHFIAFIAYIILLSKQNSVNLILTGTECNIC